MRLRKLAAYTLGAVITLACLYFGSAWRIRAQSDQIVKAGSELLRRGEPAQARATVAWLLWVDPAHPLANLLAARSYASEENIVEAARHLRNVPADSVERRPALSLLASIGLRSGDLIQAEKALVELTERFPSDDNAAEELHWLYYNQFRNREARRMHLRRLERQPASFPALNHLMNIEHRPQVPRESLPYLETIDGLRPGQPEVLAAVAQCRMLIGELDAARRALEQMLQCETISLRCRLVAAEYFLEVGDLERSLQFLSDEPTASPYSDRWYWLRAKVAQIQGDARTAYLHIDKAVAQRPSESGYWHLRGVLGRLLEKEFSEDVENARRIDDARAQLQEKVLSGSLRSPTAETCRETARLCRRAGRILEADGWEQLATYSGR